MRVAEALPGVRGHRVPFLSGQLMRALHTVAIFESAERCTDNYRARALRRKGFQRADLAQTSTGPHAVRWYFAGELPWRWRDIAKTNWKWTLAHKAVAIP